MGGGQRLDGRTDSNRCGSSLERLRALASSPRKWGAPKQGVPCVLGVAEQGRCNPDGMSSTTSLGSGNSYQVPLRSDV